MNKLNRQFENWNSNKRGIEPDAEMDAIRKEQHQYHKDKTAKKLNKMK
jgi:hypothetical protein